MFLPISAQKINTLTKGKLGEEGCSEPNFNKKKNGESDVEAACCLVQRRKPYTFGGGPIVLFIVGSRTSKLIYAWNSKQIQVRNTNYITYKFRNSILVASWTSKLHVSEFHIGDISWRFPTVSTCRTKIQK
jgi:hypothetical protein